MTIGEKITTLRTKANLSQEEFADKMYVSRQAISRWELNQALPQLDKIIQICNFFKISTDISRDCSMTEICSAIFFS